MENNLGILPDYHDGDGSGGIPRYLKKGIQPNYMTAQEKRKVLPDLPTLGYNPHGHHRGHRFIGPERKTK